MLGGDEIRKLAVSDGNKMEKIRKEKPHLPSPSSPTLSFPLGRVGNVVVKDKISRQ